MKVAVVLNSKINQEIEGDYFVGVDGGTIEILKQGKIPNLIVGDFDSFTEFKNNNCTDVERITLKRDKDLTDSKVALQELILNRKFKEIDIYGIEGGRLDHIYENINLITYAGKMIKSGIRGILDSGFLYYYDRDTKVINAKKGDTVSIFSRVETTVFCSTGLKYSLSGKTLTIGGDICGISNVALVDNPTLEILSGSGVIFVYNSVA